MPAGSKRERSDDDSSFEMLNPSNWGGRTNDEVHTYVMQAAAAPPCSRMHLEEDFKFSPSFIRLVHVMKVFRVPVALMRQVVLAMGVPADDVAAAMDDPRIPLAALDADLRQKEVATMAAWTAASRQALVALILTRHDNAHLKTVGTVSLSTIVESNAETTLRPQFDELAKPKAAFQLATVKLLPARTLSCVIEGHPQSKTLGSRKFWTFDGALRDRHVDVDELEDLAAWPTDALVVVLSGESGSGKTTTALAHFLKMDVSTRAVLLVPTAPSDDALELMRAGATLPQNRTERNRMVREWITERLTDAVENHFGGRLESMDGVAALIFDELGNARSFLRGLCAVLREPDFVPSLCGILGVSRVEVVACGTGVDVVQHGALELATSQESFCLTNMSAEGNSTSFRDRQLRRLQHPQLEASLRGYLTPELQTAWRVMYNRRAAALFVCEYREEQKTSEWSAWAITGTHDISARVVMTTRRVVERFRSLNALMRLSKGAVSQRFAEALHLVMSRTVRDVEGSQLELLTTFGLITDNVRLELSTSRIAAPLNRTNGDTVLSCVQDSAVPGQYILSVLPHTCHGGRYQMTEAVLEMGVQAFGFVARPRIGVGFERTVVDYLFVYLQSCAVSRGGASECARLARGRAADAK